MLKTIAELLESIRQRGMTSKGIGLASLYFNEFAFDNPGVRSKSGSTDKLDIKAALNKAAETLCFRPGGDVFLNVTKTAKSGTGVVTRGKPKRKNPDSLTKDSICDFECIATSDSKDRDGDILLPKGATIDPKMPVLWQHNSWEPIGRMVEVLDQNEKDISLHCALADTPLARDAATLMAFDCLRVSQGFKPTKFEPIEDDKDGMIIGWKIHEYEMMEISLVSVPSNRDAVITCDSRSKLHDPRMKAWAGRLRKEQATIVPTRRPSTTNSAKAGNTVINIKNVLPTESTKKQPQDAGLGGKEAAVDKTAGAKEATTATTLTKLAESLTTLSETSMPAEANNRMKTASGLVSEVASSIADGMDLIEAIGTKDDLGTDREDADKLVGECCKKLKSASRELKSVCKLDEVDGVAEIKAMSVEIDIVVDALSGMTAELSGEKTVSKKATAKPATKVADDDEDDDKDADDSEIEEDEKSDDDDEDEDKKSEDDEDDDDEKSDDDDDDDEKSEDDEEDDDEKSDDDDDDDDDEKDVEKAATKLLSLMVQGRKPSKEVLTALQRGITSALKTYES